MSSDGDVLCGERERSMARGVRHDASFVHVAVDVNLTLRARHVVLAQAHAPARGLRSTSQPNT